MTDGSIHSKGSQKGFTAQHYILANNKLNVSEYELLKIDINCKIVTNFNIIYRIFYFSAVSGDSGDTSGTGSTEIALYSTRDWLKMEANYLL